MTDKNIVNDTIHKLRNEVMNIEWDIKNIKDQKIVAIKQNKLDYCKKQLKILLAS